MKRLALSVALFALALSATPARAEPPARPVPEALDLPIVRRAIHRAGRDALRACWREARERGAAERGRVVLLFTVDRSGRVSRREVLSSELGAPLGRCAADAIAAIGFPLSRSTVTITFPIEFAPRPPRGRAPRVSTDPRRPYVVVP